MDNKKTMITAEEIGRGLGYEQYHELVETLWKDNKGTGEDHSQHILDYTRLNLQRMGRWEKKMATDPLLEETISRIDRPMYWVVLTEGWCGDAAQNLPFIHRMSSWNDGIELVILLRDQHPDIMDQYLTNGGRAIPKLIAIEKESMEELAVWGPRPARARQILIDHKSRESFDYDAFNAELHSWYAKDKGKTLQQEFTELFKPLGERV